MDIFFGPSGDFSRIFKKAIFVGLTLETKEVEIDRPYEFMESEPIFSSILHNMVLGQSFLLLWKTRIKIRDSAVLIGVVDAPVDDFYKGKEKPVLKPDEVFCQIARFNFRKFQCPRTKSKLKEVLKELQIDDHSV